MYIYKYNMYIYIYKFDMYIYIYMYKFDMYIYMICIYIYDMYIYICINDTWRFLKSWGIPTSARVSILSPRPLDPEKSMPSWRQRPIGQYEPIIPRCGCVWLVSENLGSNRTQSY